MVTIFQSNIEEKNKRRGIGVGVNIVKCLKITTIVLIICISMNSVCYAQKKENQSKQTTYEAPDFTVYDENGKAVKLSDYIGKPIVLCFWASWCEPCEICLNVLDENNKEENNVTILLVNLTDGTKETIESANAFLKKNKIGLPSYFDTTNQAASRYRIAVIPATFFIDKQGKLVAYAQGAITKEILKKGVEMIQKR